MSLQVLPIPGEATRYHCESNSLECVNTKCGRDGRNGEFIRTLFSRHHRPDLGPGMKCPECKTGTLDIRYHLVCVSDFNGVGSCSCEYFERSPMMRKALSLMLPNKRKELAEHGDCKFRCAHINRVRTFCLNLTINAHEAGRYENAGTQREE